MQGRVYLAIPATVRRSDSRQFGPIAALLAKKEAEQEPKTLAGYRTTLMRFRQSWARTPRSVTSPRSLATAS